MTHGEQNTQHSRDFHQECWSTIKIDTSKETHTCQRLARAARKHDNTTSGTSVTKHFGQTSLLVSTNACVRFQVHLRYIWIDGVISEVIFFH